MVFIAFLKLTVKSIKLKGSEKWALLNPWKRVPHTRPTHKLPTVYYITILFPG